MTITKKSQDKNTYLFNVHIPAQDVTKAYDESFTHMQKDLQVEGFRKGKVPKDIAKKHLKPDSVYEHAAQDIISEAYKQILAEYKIQPLASPRIELKSAQKDADWELELSVAVRPTVVLGDYKAVIAEVKKEAKAGAIWTPGKTEEKKDPQQEQREREQLLQAILQKLIAKIVIEISPILIESELNKRLTRLVDDVQKIGLSMDGYLASKSETMDSVKEKYTKEIEESLKLEFILDELADAEKVTLEKEEMDKFLASMKAEGNARDIETNAYLYAMLLRRQKLFDVILGM